MILVIIQPNLIVVQITWKGWTIQAKYDPQSLVSTPGGGDDE